MGQFYLKIGPQITLKLAQFVSHFILINYMFHERASSFNYRHLRCTGDSNSRQHGKKSPSLTTRPGLPTLNQLSFGQRNFSGNGLIEFRLMAGVDVPTKINVRKRVFLIFREKSFFLEKVKIGFFVNSRECHLCSNLRKRERKSCGQRVSASRRYIKRHLR